MPLYAEHDGRSGRTVIVARPIPDPLWIWFGWDGPPEALVWRCFRCGAEFPPFHVSARGHALEHWEAARALGEAERYLEQARADATYQLEVARGESAYAAEREERRRAWAVHYAAIEWAEPEEVADRLVAPLLARGPRFRYVRVGGAEWHGLHRRRCVCEACAARHPERLADKGNQRWFGLDLPRSRRRFPEIDLRLHRRRVNGRFVQVPERLAALLAAGARYQARQRLQQADTA